MFGITLRWTSIPSGEGGGVVTILLASDYLSTLRNQGIYSKKARNLRYQNN